MVVGCKVVIFCELRGIVVVLLVFGGCWRNVFVWELNN